MLAAVAGLILAGLIVAGVVAVLGFVMGIPVMLLWNAVMPDIFGVPDLSYLQAVGLYILCGLLLKSSSSNSSSNSSSSLSSSRRW